MNSLLKEKTCLPAGSKHAKTKFEAQPGNSLLKFLGKRLIFVQIYPFLSALLVKTQLNGYKNDNSTQQKAPQSSHFM